MTRILVGPGQPRDYVAAATRAVERLNLPPEDIRAVRVVAEVGDVLKVEIVVLARAEDLVEG